MGNICAKDSDHQGQQHNDYLSLNLTEVHTGISQTEFRYTICQTVIGILHRQIANFEMRWSDYTGQVHINVQSFSCLQLA